MLPGRTVTVDYALRVLRRRGWLLIGALFVGVLGGLLYSRLQPSLYRSDAVVQVVPQRIPDSYVHSTVTARVEDWLSSLAQEVLSRTQLEAVIHELNLYPVERRAKTMEEVFELMAKGIQVMPIEATRRTQPGVDAFRISFYYEDPRIARDVVNRLASFFIDRNAAERGSQADQTSSFLETQLSQARSRLEAQERKLESFRKRNSGRLPTQTQTNMQAIQNSQMTLQATVESLARDRDRKLMLERLYADAATDALSGLPVAPALPGGAPGAAASKLPPDATPRQQLMAQRNLLTQLQLRLGPRHPDVIRTQHTIEELERQVALESGTPADPAQEVALNPEATRRRERLREMRAELESLDRQIAFKEGEERRLRGDIGGYQARLEAVPGIESEWVSLTRDYETLQATYRDLLSKSENSKMAASLEQRQIGEQFRLLDPPRVPLKPYMPNRLKINLIGTFTGLTLGLLLLGVLEYTDSTMRSKADLQGALELPVLALLPYVTTQADLREQGRRRRVVSAGAAGVCLTTAALFWFLQLWKYVV